MINDFDNLISFHDMSKILNIKKGTLYNWVSQRKLPYIKLGKQVLFNKYDIDEWIETKKVSPVEF